MAVADLAHLSKNEALASLQNLKNRMASFKKDAERIAQLGSHVALTTAGGAAAGVLNAKMPKIPGTEVRTDLAFGGVAVAAALMGWTGDYGEEAIAFGGGLLAVAAARETEKVLSAH